MADLNQPLPDRAHEALRAALVAALADLGQKTTDSADSFDLLDVAFELIDALGARLDALENPTT
jgi:hypothetical protein